MANEKIAPVQGYSAGIPWSMHLRAYDAYCKKWGPQPALIDLDGRHCRGGFSIRELDDFIPGWRDELNEITRLRALLHQAEEALRALRNEVLGILGYAKEGIRPIVGNTNLAVLQEKLDKAHLALAAIAPERKEQK